MGIVERGAPGGVNVNIWSARAVADGTNVDQQNPETGDKLTIPVDSRFTFRVEVENAGGTGFLSADNCDGGAGTNLVLVYSFAGLEPTEADIKCHPDNAIKDTPTTLFYEFEAGPFAAGSGERIEFWIEGYNTDDRMTPVYYLDMVAEADSGGGGGGDGGGESGFGLSDLAVDCSLSTQSAAVGDTVTISYSVEGFAPSEYHIVDVDLYSNGTRIDTKTANVTVNGSGGGEFAVQLPDSGDYDFNVELSNLRLG